MLSAPPPARTGRGPGHPQTRRRPLSGWRPPVRVLTALLSHGQLRHRFPFWHRPLPEGGQLRRGAGRCFGSGASAAFQPPRAPPSADACWTVQKRDLSSCTSQQPAAPSPGPGAGGYGTGRSGRGPCPVPGKVVRPVVRLQLGGGSRGTGVQRGEGRGFPRGSRHRWKTGRPCGNSLRTCCRVWTRRRRRSCRRRCPRNWCPTLKADGSCGRRS